MILLPVILFTLAGAGPARAGVNPRELGAVHWRRDLEAARAEGARTGRPLLVLFQEVPGCQTCVNFGRGPMSQPLIVEVIQTGFVPVAIFNNRPGADRRALEACREPAFNNPVMRFFDAQGRDLIPRRDGVYGTGGVAARLAAALGGLEGGLAIRAGFMDGREAARSLGERAAR